MALQGFFGHLKTNYWIFSIYHKKTLADIWCFTVVFRASLLQEMAKNNNWPVTGLGNKGCLKILNGTKLIIDDHGNNLNSFRIILESFSFFRGPLLLKPVTGQELSFAVSYSEPALVDGLSNKKETIWQKGQSIIQVGILSQGTWPLGDPTSWKCAKKRYLIKEKSSALRSVSQRNSFPYSYRYFYIYTYTNEENS